MSVPDPGIDPVVTSFRDFMIQLEWRASGIERLGLFGDRASEQARG